jgi:hypothetical protein
VLRAAARVSLTKESLPRALFSKGKGALRLPQAFDKRPSFMGTARVNMQEGVPRLRALVTASGGGRDLERAERDLRQALGIGIDDLPAVLDGEVGLVLTVEPVQSRGFLGFLDGIRGAALVGLKDAKRMDGLFQKAAAMAGQKPDAQGRVQFQFNKEHTLTAGVSGKYLAVASDAAVFTRIGKGDSSASLVGAVGNAALKALFEKANPAQLWAFDGGAWAVAFSSERHRAGALAFKKALGPSAARVELDDGALTIEAGQFFGAKSVPEGMKALSTFLNVAEGW